MVKFYMFVIDAGCKKVQNNEFSQIDQLMEQANEHYHMRKPHFFPKRKCVVPLSNAKKCVVPLYGVQARRDNQLYSNQ